MANFTNIGVGPGPKKQSPVPPRFGAKKPDGVAVVVGMGPSKPPPMGGVPPADDEAGESPSDEGREEFGSKLVQDIETAGASVGIHDPAKARKAAGAFFRAAAECLSSDAEPPMGDLGDGMGEGGE